MKLFLEPPFFPIRDLIFKVASRILQSLHSWSTAQKHYISVGTKRTRVFLLLAKTNVLLMKINSCHLSDKCLSRAKNHVQYLTLSLILLTTCEVHDNRLTLQMRKLRLRIKTHVLILSWVTQPTLAEWESKPMNVQLQSAVGSPMPSLPLHSLPSRLLPKIVPSCG